jgi:hypothetical protein
LNYFSEVAFSTGGDVEDCVRDASALQLSHLDSKRAIDWHPKRLQLREPIVQGLAGFFITGNDANFMPGLRNFPVLSRIQFSVTLNMGVVGIKEGCDQNVTRNQEESQMTLFQSLVQSVIFLLNEDTARSSGLPTASCREIRTDFLSQRFIHSD